MDSVYEKRPWLKNYPEWVPHELKITPSTAIGDFKSSAIRRPQNPAVYYFDSAISYEKIDKLSDSLAAALSDFGLKKGERIILDFQNVPQFQIVIYAAWKLGAIVVPVNPMYKEKELSYFCKDSGAKVLFILDEIAEILDLSFLEGTSIEKIITLSIQGKYHPHGKPLTSLN